MSNEPNTGKRQSLLCLELRSVATGYRVLQIVAGFEELEILEASPAGDRFLVLATGPAAQLEMARENARSAVDTDQWLDSEVLTDCAPTLLEALYHLPQVHAEEALVVTDCASVSGLIVAAQAMLNDSGVQVIELKIKRAGGGGYGFFTGSTILCAPGAEEARAKLKRTMREGQIEVIEDLALQFRRYFNLNGLE